jgi:hypothetical protein
VSDPTGVALLVDEVIARLTAELPDISVTNFPDDPAKYPFGKKAAELLVNYGGSDYGDPDAIAPISQPRDVDVEVTLLMRNLRGPTGATEAIDRVRVALTGWRASLGGAALTPVRDRFVAHADGVWRFVITFRTTIPAVQQLDDLTGTPLTGSTSDEETFTP